MASRRKAAAVDAPQTKAEAIALAEEYAKVECAIVDSQKLLDFEVARAKSDHAARMANLEPRLQAAFAGLRAWWSSNAAELTKGKRRSIELGPVTLGERTGMPKLKLPKGMKAEGAVSWLKAMKYKYGLLSGFIRLKEEIDKPEIIKVVRAAADAEESVRQAQVELLKAGFTVTQAEEFFIRTGEDETPVDMESQTRPTS